MQDPTLGPISEGNRGRMQRLLRLACREPCWPSCCCGWIASLLAASKLVAMRPMRFFQPSMAGVSACTVQHSSSSDSLFHYPRDRPEVIRAIAAQALPQACGPHAYAETDGIVWVDAGCLHSEWKLPSPV